jgi:hypothetical protein
MNVTFVLLVAALAALVMARGQRPARAPVRARTSGRRRCA